MEAFQASQGKNGKAEQPQQKYQSFQCSRCMKTVRYTLVNTPAIALCPSCMELELGMSYDPVGEIVTG